MANFLEVHAFVPLSGPSPTISAGCHSQFCRCAAAPDTAVAPVIEKEVSDRTAIRLGLPSKGRTAEETLNLLKNCQLTMRQVDPRQYVAAIPQKSSVKISLIIAEGAVFCGKVEVDKMFYSAVWKLRRDRLHHMLQVMQGNINRPPIMMEI